MSCVVVSTDAALPHVIGPPSVPVTLTLYLTDLASAGAMRDLTPWRCGVVPPGPTPTRTRAGMEDRNDRTSGHHLGHRTKMGRRRSETRAPIGVKTDRQVEDGKDQER